MRKKKAVSVILKQISKLEAEISYNDTTWLIQTRSYIKVIFGENSEEFLYMKKFSYTGMYSDHFEQDFRRSKLQAAKFLENCIESVQNNSVSGEKQNFLEKIIHQWPVPAIITIVTLICSCGYGAGKLVSDIQNEKVQDNLEKKDAEITILKDTLMKLHKSKGIPVINVPSNPQQKNQK